MCFPKPPQDNSAALARQQEQEREQRINQGKGSIDRAFSVFTPDYFNKYQNDYLGYYNPQVDQKYGLAQQDLRYNLARAGTLDATPGQKAFGMLAQAYTDQRRAVESDALDATNKVRTQVEQNKSDLYAQNTASADPSLAATSALSRAGSLQTTPSYSPVGDLFSGFTNAGSAYLQGLNKGLPTGYASRFQPGASIPGYSSNKSYNLVNN